MIADTLVTIPAWGRVTLLEAIWLASGVMAVMFTLAHMRALVEDYLAAAGTGRPVLSAVAWAYLRRETIRFLQGLCLSVIGIYACWQPSPAPGPSKVSVIGLVLTFVLFSLGLLVSLQSHWDWKTRHEVQRLIVEQNGQAATTKEQS